MYTVYSVHKAKKDSVLCRKYGNTTFIIKYQVCKTTICHFYTSVFVQIKHTVCVNY